jgi:hypothetical protein
VGRVAENEQDNPKVSESLGNFAIAVRFLLKGVAIQVQSCFDLLAISIQSGKKAPIIKPFSPQADTIAIAESRTRDVLREGVGCRL